MATNGAMSIQQAAAQLGLSVHTLRYYERVGLIAPVARAASGHRQYSADDLSWLKLLSCLRATGMSIQGMREYAAIRQRNSDNDSVDEALAALENHRDHVVARQRQLERDLAVIDAKIARLRARGSLDGAPLPAAMPRPANGSEARPG